MKYLVMQRSWSWQSGFDRVT